MKCHGFGPATCLPPTVCSCFWNIIFLYYAVLMLTIPLQCSEHEEPMNEVSGQRPFCPRCNMSSLGWSSMEQLRLESSQLSPIDILHCCSPEEFYESRTFVSKILLPVQPHFHRHLLRHVQHRNPNPTTEEIWQTKHRNPCLKKDQQEMLMPPGDIGGKSMHTNPPSPNTPLPPAPVPNGWTCHPFPLA